MNLVVSVAPHADGFRASTGSPLDLTADGPTADAAVDGLRGLVAARLFAGEIRTIHVPEPWLAADPTPDPQRDADFDALREAIAENRRVYNTVPDAG
jgi:hypothetical protein